MIDIQKLINEYSEWIKNEISVSRFGEYFELTTPYLDRFNDYLQIYVKQEENKAITLSDDGYIIENLISSGMSLRSGSKRRQMIESIISNYSLRLNGNEIIADANEKNFPLKKHLLVQAMLAIDDIYEINSKNIESFFIEDIETYLRSHEIYYSKNFSIIGKTGSFINYDFHFQKTRNKPERFCKAINRLTEANRNLTIFNWIDTQEKRNFEGDLIVFLNDQDYPVESEDIEAFDNYDIYSCLFSKREECIEAFA